MKWILVVACATGVPCGLTGEMRYPLPAQYDLEACFAIARKGFEVGGYNADDFRVECEFDSQRSNPAKK